MQTIESLTELLRMAHEQIDTEVAKIAELEKALKAVKKDLLMRAEEDSDGCKVVELSWSVWLQLKEALKEQS